MKNAKLLFFTIVLGLVGGMLCPTGLRAQANDGGKMLSFLSAEDRLHFMKVRREVMARNPDLKTEQESLVQERKYVKDKGTDATADDRKTLRNNFLAHSEKVQAAMLKADPSVSPILDQINARIKDRLGDSPNPGGGAAPSN
jgi:hypothetical protein